MRRRTGHRGHAAVAAVLFLGSCGGTSPPLSGAEIATFCGAWKKVQEIPTDSSFLTIKEIDDLIKRLEAAGKELDKAVPADIREQFDIDNRFANLSEDEQYEPKERQRDREASAKIDAYVADRCG